MPESARTAIVLVAHGSRAAPANDAHRELARDVAARVGVDVRPAFLEIASPSIADAIDAVVAEGAARVLVHPHFLAPGNHTTVDIPRIVQEARDRHAGVALVLTEHTGADPAMAAALAERLGDELR